MEEYKNKYIDYLLNTRGYSEAYKARSSYYIKKFMEFLYELNIINISDVTKGILEQYQQKIMEKKDLENLSKSYMLRPVIKFFEYLYDYEYIKENIGLIIEIPKVEKKIPRDIMNQSELKYLLSLPDKQSLMGMRDFCIMNLLYTSAMRIKEVSKLTIEDFDFKRKQITIKRPKNRCDRIAYIDGYTANYIKKYMENVRPWFPKKDKDTGLLFLSNTGTPIDTQNMSHYFHKKYAPLMYEKFKKRLVPYSFRHTSATHWLDEGAKRKKDLLPYVQRQLGHKSLESTAVYTHVAIEPLRQMFKNYHPLELRSKHLHKIPSPTDIISRLKDEK